MAFTELMVPRTLDTSEHNLVGDFFSPMLRHSVRYDRAVGYFSSGWLRTNAQGMVAFASNGGHARWITSPILSDTDWNYLQKGEEARNDEILREALRHNINDLETSLEHDTLSALAWMVADGIIDFRLALPHSKLEQGDFHDKFGIFEDGDGNQVSFNGSYNDSIQGLRNYESLKVFSSWDATSSFVDDDAGRFQRLWENEDPFVRIYLLPEAAQRRILELRTHDRPYPEPDEVRYPTNLSPGAVREPGIELWDHQREAIEAWVENGCVGILNMATGSGKTVTALIAAETRPDLQLLVVAVPTKNLVEQWDEELRAITGLPEPILVYESSARWQDRVFRKLRAGHRQAWPRALVLIGTVDSLSGDRFQSVLSDAGVPEHAMLIVDEVHNVGAPTYQRILGSTYSMRLGLSATPERKYDEQGSEAIMEFFDKEVYRYSMEEALDDGRLSPYDYYVYPARLSESEYEEYLQLTRRLLAARSDESNQGTTLFTNNKVDGDTRDVEMLLFRRADILKKAAAKTDLVRTILDNHVLDRGLIYCADKEQLGEVQGILHELDVVHLKYIGETPSEKRRSALDALASGQVPAIVAIDCLDEGVDVPVVDTAIILASSTNERQFIQRRGRVLRKAPGKKKATLIDAVALPPSSAGRDGKWILKGELARAKKMAELADNQHEALLRIKDMTKQYGVLLTELLMSDSDATPTD
jgi:superfamily II DNA or RNA helicase